ncbi:MAG TPA: hypothetical protein VK024_02565 [Actinomycetaceae bacterium]|nr:hypothetical protein [Actinomycetaceae bacterium]
MTLALLALVALSLLWLPPSPAVPGARAARCSTVVGRYRRGWRRRRWRRPDLGVIATEVASRLRAGAPAQRAWHDTLVRHGLPAAEAARAGDDGVPAGLAGLDVGRDPAGGQRAALAATIAACRLTHEVGAPLADVLDRCAAGITEAADARDARRIALAGPRATARVLTWLPVAGAGLGIVIGADPLAVFLDASWGSAALCGGLALMVAGRRWATLLLRAAQHGSAASPATRRRAAAGHAQG